MNVYQHPTGSLWDHNKGMPRAAGSSSRGLEQRAAEKFDRPVE
jgi:hypothetical protein